LNLRVPLLPIPAPGADGVTEIGAFGLADCGGAFVDSTAKTVHLDREAELHGAIALASWR
jgi:hypothetical protein